MTDFEKKEEKIVVDIVKALTDLEEELNKLSNDNVKHKRFVEKKALHDIKRILHEAGKYDKYNNKELEELEDIEYSQETSVDF